jgi:hypothetical protein
MKKFLVLLLVFFGVIVFAQTPMFTKYNVASTSVQIYLPTEPKWDQSTSEDGSEIFIYDGLFGNINYNAIIVKLNPTVVNDKPENLLESYMIYLENSVFTLDQKAGFGKGHSLDNQPKVHGILQMGKSKNTNNKTKNFFIFTRFPTVFSPLLNHLMLHQKVLDISNPFFPKHQ